MASVASITEVVGQAQGVDTDADWTICFVGPSTSSPVAAGKLTSAYSNPAAAATDLGQGDAPDALIQAIAVTPGNPAPPAALFYRTPSTTPGTYNTIDISGVVGTAVPANNTAIVASGTYQPWLKIVVGFTVGVTGGTADASLDGGHTTKRVAIGASAEYNFPAADGWDRGGGQAGFTFGPPTANLAALYTKITALQTAMVAHFTRVTASTHLAADTTDNAALTAVPAATTPATGVTLFNACLSRLGLHGANTTYHTIADAALATALALITVAVTIEDVDLSLPALIAAYNAHRINTAGTVHGAADNTNTITAWVSAPGTLIAGDVFFTSTNPPIWGDSDLYSAGPPAVGAFAAIAESAQLVATIVITEPVAVGDFSTLVAGLNYGKSYGKLWSLIVRFRDPLPAGETDAAYITAFQTFKAAMLDSRITCLAGSGYLTDVFSTRVYLRSGLAAYVARLQSCFVVAGTKGERGTQNPGWVKRGPLENFSVVDALGNNIGHDELIRSGIGVNGGNPTGGGVTFCYRRDVQNQGTYVIDNVTVLYPIGVPGGIYTPMDRWLANRLESVAIGELTAAIGGADIISDPSTPPVLLDPAICDAIAGSIMATIRGAYADEFQNANDQNFVTVNQTVTLAGPIVTATGNMHPRFYGYQGPTNMTFTGSR